MPKVIDLTGQRIGQIEVISLLPMKQDKCRLWFCFCHACERYRIKKAGSLSSKNIKACGCARPGVVNLCGRRFGRLIVIERAENDSFGSSKWLCQCSCGNQIIANAGNLRNTHTTSCGCYRLERNRTGNITHGKTGSRIYQSWASMISRCFNEKNLHYKDYGGRGITVCARWRKSFQSFLEDMGERPESMSLDRTNNDGNYEPGNCQWATAKQQANNRRPRRKAKSK